MTETPNEVARETAEGRSSRTPWLALSGVTVVLGALVAVILIAALLVYYLA